MTKLLKIVMTTAWLSGLWATGCLEGPDKPSAATVREVTGLSQCTVKVHGHHYLAALLPYEGIWAVGDNTEKAIILALSEINDQGGIHGRSLGLVVCNTKGDALTAKSLMEEIIDASPISAVIGTMRSSSMVSAAKVAIGDGIVMISPAATANAIDALDDGGWIYRIAPAADFLGRVASKIAQQEGLKKIFAINIDEFDGNGLRTSFVDAFETAGWASGQVTYDENDPDLADAALSAAYGYGPEGVFLIGLHEDSISVVRTAADRSFKLGQWLLGPGVKNQIFLDGVGNDAFLEGALGLGPCDSTSDDYATFAASYNDKWRTTPEAFSAHAYDAAYLVAMAMALAGDPDDRVDVRDHLSATTSGAPVHPGKWRTALDQVPFGEMNYQGASGPVDFQPNGSTAGNIETWMITGGGFQSVACWTPDAEPC